MAGAAGYSGKPLHQKLGIKDAMTVGVVRSPDHHGDLMSGAPACTWHHAKAASALPASLNMVHLFCACAADLDADHAQATQKLAEGGMLWVSWPKKSSPLFADLTEGMIRSAILPEGVWVDVKVCAVDKDWSGLKFLRRKQ